MANNIFSNLLNSAGDWMAAKIAPYINDALGQRSNILEDYYNGDHYPQLKTTIGKDGRVINDNIIQNFVGLAVDRSVSRLFRGGVTFNLPSGADEQKAYLDRVWELNKKSILLYQVGLHGAVHGTSYFKICPNEMIDPYTNQLYPKLIPIDPSIIRVVVESDDMNDVEMYIIEYQKDNQVGYREVTRHANPTESEAESELTPDTWVVEEWEQSPQYGNQWTLVSSVPWSYNFPPILHWKNLPSLKSCYGDSDIDDVIGIQNKSNFVVSNTGKIIKFHAHPQTIGTGFSIKNMESLDGAVNSFTVIPTEAAKVFNLEMQSDLASSRAFALDLRQSIFDIAREVDISSMADKVGSLTNFGLQILWSDAIDKNDTKRQLYGDALTELNRRLLVLNNWIGEASNPGRVVWGNAMPVDITEEISTDKTALEIGIVDKETVAKRYQARYGVDWETIQSNLENEKSAANQGNADIGSLILRNFNQGQGAPMPSPAAPRLSAAQMMQEAAANNANQ